MSTVTDPNPDHVNEMDIDVQSSLAKRNRRDEEEEEEENEVSANLDNGPNEAQSQGIANKDTAPVRKKKKPSEDLDSLVQTRKPARRRAQAPSKEPASTSASGSKVPSVPPENGSQAGSSPSSEIQVDIQHSREGTPDGSKTPTQNAFTPPTDIPSHGSDSEAPVSQRLRSRTRNATNESDYAPSAPSELPSESDITTSQLEDHEGQSEAPVKKKRAKAKQTKSSKGKEKEVFVPEYVDDRGSTGAPITITPDVAALLAQELKGHLGSVLAGDLVESIRDGVATEFRGSMHDFATRFDDLKAELKEQKEAYRKLEEANEALREKLNEVSSQAPQNSHRQKEKTSSKFLRNGLAADLKDHPKVNPFRHCYRYYIKRILLKLHADEEDDDAAMDLDKPSDDGENGDDDDDDDEVGQDPILKQVPLTDEEHTAWCRKSPGCIKVTVDNFRYDFTRPPSDIFNKDAIHVGIEGFRKEWDEGSFDGVMGFEDEDERKAIGDSFLTQRSLRYSFSTYFKNLQARYMAATTEAGQEHWKRQHTQAARRTRLATTTRIRVKACKAFPTLHPYLDLLEQLGTRATSEDETDYETLGGGQRVKIYRTVSPGWRSKDLEKFLHFLDWAWAEVQKTHKMKTRPAGYTQKQAKRRRDDGGDVRLPGGPPRLRIYQGKINNNREAAKHLMSNCYSSAWYKKQSESQRFDLAMKKGSYTFPTDYDALKKKLGGKD